MNVNRLTVLCGSVMFVLYTMKRVLVIEDDETVREVLRSFLGQKGFEVTLAQNGESGLDLLRAEKFDLIFTDLVMPGISGMEVLKEVVASKIAVPVVVMTAFGTVQTAVEAMRIGAFDYITKPFSPKELLARINALEPALKSLSDEQLRARTVGADFTAAASWASVSAAERSGSVKSMSTPIAAGPAAAIARSRSAVNVRGHGHWPRASSERSSISTMTAGALSRARGARRCHRSNTCSRPTHTGPAC